MKNLLATSFCVALFVAISHAQPATEYFYYHADGRKLTLVPDPTAISLSVEEQPDLDFYSRNFLDGTWTTVMDVQSDYARQMVEPTDRQASDRKSVRSYYTSIRADQPVSIENYAAKIKSCQATRGVITAAPAFKGDGQVRIGLTSCIHVKLRTDAQERDLYRVASANGLEVLGRQKERHLWYILACTAHSGINSLQAANRLFETGLFESSTPDFVHYNIGLSSDPLYPIQWSLYNTGQSNGTPGIDIKVDQAWATINGTGSGNIVTAVMDLGFQTSHPDLAASVGPLTKHFDVSTNMPGNISPAGVYTDWNGYNHGTPCAGIVAAVQNNIGITGVAPGTKIVPVSMNFYSGLTTTKIINGFDFCKNNGIDIVSCSWSWSYDPALTAPVVDCINNGRSGAGCVVIFAAGNSGNNQVTWPAGCDPKVLTVGAVDRCGYRSGILQSQYYPGVPVSCEQWVGGASQYGPDLDVMAGGTSIMSTDLTGAAGYVNGDYYNFNGTSASCPAVAGVAALVLSANPNLTGQQVRDIIEQTCQKVRPNNYTYATTSGRPNGTWNNEMGYGLVNAFQAVMAALNTLCAQNLNITANVSGTDNQQAAQTINASNVIYGGGVAKYHAGDQVKMSPGFYAAAGSDFHAYPVACSGVYYRAANTTQSQDQSLPEQYSSGSNIVADDGGSIVVVPNPSSGSFAIELPAALNVDKVDIKVTDLFGRTVLNKSNCTSKRLNVDLTDHPVGLYNLVVTTGSKLFTCKLVKM